MVKSLKSFFWGITILKNIVTVTRYSLHIWSQEEFFSLKRGKLASFRPTLQDNTLNWMDNYYIFSQSYKLCYYGKPFPAWLRSNCIKITFYSLEKQHLFFSEVSETGQQANYCARVTVPQINYWSTQRLILLTQRSSLKFGGLQSFLHMYKILLLLSSISSDILCWFSNVSLSLSNTFMLVKLQQC